jgi:hypothetical protein
MMLAKKLQECPEECLKVRVVRRGREGHIDGLRKKKDRVAAVSLHTRRAPRILCIQSD